VTVAALSETEQAVLPAIDGVKLKALIEGQKGKVVVLAAWSATDAASTTLYPKLAQLAAPEAKAGPVVIAVNVDGLSDARAKALPLVTAHKGATVNHALVGGTMELMGLVDIAWGGKPPALWLYDHEGKQAEERFEGADAAEKAAETLKKLVKAAGRR
ncbi:hypothetical protein ACFL09_04305, partial [Planctomycetota bacterium]